MWAKGMSDVVRHPAGKIQFALLMHSSQLNTPEHYVALVDQYSGWQPAFL